MTEKQLKVKSVAADGKTQLVSIAGQPLLVSAVEFNRLHTVNADLLKALKELLDMDVAYGRGPKVIIAVDAARDAITKAEATK